MQDSLQYQRTIKGRHPNERFNTLVYTAYGYINKPPPAVYLGFTGQRYDSFTNCYLLGEGYRAYSPSLARFLSPDNLSPFGQGGRNAYAYGANDPINHVDPSGHMPSKKNTNVGYVNYSTSEQAYQKMKSVYKSRKDLYKKSKTELVSLARDATQRIAGLEEVDWASPSIKRKYLLRAAELPLKKQLVTLISQYDPDETEANLKSHYNQYVENLEKKLIEKNLIKKSTSTSTLETLLSDSNSDIRQAGFT